MNKNNFRHNIIQRLMRFVKFRILHIDDTPHRLALGVALGFLVAFTPAIGLHVVIVLALAALCRANKFTGFASIWICNPLTFMPIYYPSYLLGRAVTGFFENASAGTVSSLPLTGSAFPSLNAFMNLFSFTFWREMFLFLIEVGPQLWIGGLIIGLFIGLIGYFVTYQFIIWHRKTNPHRRYRKHL